MNRGRSLISAHTNTSVELFNNSLTRNRLRGAIAQKQLTIQSEKKPRKKNGSNNSEYTLRVERSRENEARNRD